MNKEADQAPDDWSYSLAYLRSGDRSPQITSATRIRLQSFLESLLGFDLEGDFTQAIRIATGFGVYGYDGVFQKRTDAAQFLDVISATYKYLVRERAHLAPGWLRFVQQVFDEQHLAFRITPKGGVRRLVDEAFEAQRVSTIEVLGGPRHAATRDKFDEAHHALSGSDQDTKTAIWHMFEAVENLFKLITGAAQMSAATIKDRLPSLLDTKYTEVVSRRSADKFQRSLQEWTEGAHFYRHAPGTEDPTPPPIELAVAFLSSGAGFLRWLAELDNNGKPNK